MVARQQFQRLGAASHIVRNAKTEAFPIDEVLQSVPDDLFVVHKQDLIKFFLDPRIFLCRRVHVHSVRPLEDLCDHPFTPLDATLSTKYFCVNTNSTRMGISDTAVPAIIVE